MNKAKMIELLRSHINQRSGLDVRNYGSRDAARQDYLRIARDGRDARLLLAFVTLRDNIDVAELVAATSAYSGRLQFVTRDGEPAIEYTVGQYFPTEYRAAACAVLASALRHSVLAEGHATREAVYNWARQELGRGIAARWFR